VSRNKAVISCKSYIAISINILANENQNTLQELLNFLKDLNAMEMPNVCISLEN